MADQVVITHLKKFRPAKGADSKALYQKRLSTFVEELIEHLANQG